MNIKPRFKVIYLEDVDKFLRDIPLKARAKIQYNIMVAQYENDPELFKKLNDDIWEFRTRFNGIAYRLFAFWDKNENALVVATHGLIKKTQKTPVNEIKRAEMLMKAYYNDKQ
ncbi:MAG: type II toxin-antitoxin system RelE/ParE family toxin [Muribaculaceae bacterium]|nr:type II toxin-antitoxin system RelE/ParE family toxin [Muribaculaceae bacterium]